MPCRYSSANRGTLLSVVRQANSLERYKTYTAFHGDFEWVHDGIDVVKGKSWMTLQQNVNEMKVLQRCKVG